MAARTDLIDFYGRLNIGDVEMSSVYKSTDEFMNRTSSKYLATIKRLEKKIGFSQGKIAETYLLNRSLGFNPGEARGRTSLEVVAGLKKQNKKSRYTEAQKTAVGVLTNALEMAVGGDFSTYGYKAKINDLTKYGSQRQILTEIRNINKRQETLISSGLKKDDKSIKVLSEYKTMLQKRFDEIEKENAGKKTEEKRKDKWIAGTIGGAVASFTNGLIRRGSTAANFVDKAIGAIGNIPGVGSFLSSILGVVKDSVVSAYSRNKDMARNYRVYSKTWDQHSYEALSTLVPGGVLENMADTAEFFRGRAALGQIGGQQWLGFAGLQNYYKSVLGGAKLPELMLSLEQDYNRLGDERFVAFAQMAGISKEVLTYLKASPEERAEIKRMSEYTANQAKNIANIKDMMAAYLKYRGVELDIDRGVYNNVSGLTSLGNPISLKSEERKAFATRLVERGERIKGMVLNVPVTVNVDGETVSKTTETKTYNTQSEIDSIMRGRA